MTVKTFAQLKADFQSEDRQDHLNDLVDTLSATGTTALKGLLETATTAEAVAITSTAHAVTPANVGSILAKTFNITFTGKNLAGACTATGLAVGDKVLGLSGLSTVGIVTSKFEATITVADQIQQSAAENLSAQNFVALIYRPS